MIDKFKSIFIIPELRKRIFFTLGVLIVARLGAHIPIPGINGEALSAAFQGYQNTLLGLYNLFAGGAFEKATLFALGIMLYICFNYNSINEYCCSILSKTPKRRGSW